MSYITLVTTPVKVSRTPLLDVKSYRGLRRHNPQHLPALDAMSHPRVALWTGHYLQFDLQFAHRAGLLQLLAALWFRTVLFVGYRSDWLFVFRIDRYQMCPIDYPH